MEVILIRFLFACLILSPAVSEPVCSKFAYVEQLLEKMVRVEFNVGQMEREIKNTKSLVLESLQQLKQTREKMTEEFEALKLEAKNALDENEVKVSKEIDDLRAETGKANKEYDERTKQLGGAVSIPNIAFKARIPSSLDPVENEVIVFTKNIVNIGNAFDNTTGIFTAPIDGTYLFTSQLCLVSGKHITFGIYIEDVLYTVGRFYEKNFYHCFNVETTAVMKANQTSSVKSWSADTGNILYGDENHRWNVFSGTLVHNSIYIIE
ncbi:uncharacterized protein LOC123559112 [Mercenaria mercenaria]|uniref:uncharacterized protein LOC123559112 n=1 Tax=Mercenaria mercenaria TaxID=6596 RepID=UPI00234F89D5|nr:uncharacterized protein LOC123559112 [Mercenaria mercenaria]